MLKSIILSLLTFLFFSCNSNSISNESKKIEEKNSNIIIISADDSIEVMDHDLYSYVNSIEEANEAIKLLTKGLSEKEKIGWRLPTYEEIKAIYLDKKKLNGFQFTDAWYLTSNISTIKFNGNIWTKNVAFAILKGRQQSFDINEPIYTNSKNFAVRPVRTIN